MHVGIPIFCLTLWILPEGPLLSEQVSTPRINFIIAVFAAKNAKPKSKGEGNS